jgi:NAD(P)-dependent dehydrogenase (short-subunit alcohol dehydrogenase family)
MGLEIFSLEGKTAVVTGASRGFGEAIAIGLAEAGADVVLAARTESALQEVAAKIEALGRKALVVPTDMMDKAAIEALASAAIDTFGKIDILVNNAGLGDSIFWPHRPSVSTCSRQSPGASSIFRPRWAKPRCLTSRIMRPPRVASIP